VDGVVALTHRPAAAWPPKASMEVLRGLWPVMRAIRTLRRAGDRLGCEANQIKTTCSSTQQLKRDEKLHAYTIRKRTARPKGSTRGHRAHPRRSFPRRTKRLGAATGEPLMLGLQCGGPTLLGNTPIGAGAAVASSFGTAERPFFPRPQKSTAPSTCSPGAR